MQSDIIKFIIIKIICISLLVCRETVVRKNKVKQLDTFLETTLKEFKERNSKYKIGPDGEIEYMNVTGLYHLEQFNNDIVMIYKTFFPENNKSVDLIKEPGSFDHNEIIKSLKMILYTLGEANLYYGYEKNAILNEKNLKEEMLWPYPLATTLCHGGRIVFLIDEKKVNNSNFVDIFFNADKRLLTPRPAASHKLSVNAVNITESNIIFEASVDLIANKLLPNYKPIHYYLNIPFGGLGNFWPEKTAVIGKEGFGINSDKNKKEQLQFGRLYVRIDNFKNFNNSSYTSILLGLEAEAPNYRGMFSDKPHDALNALQNPTTSVCGGSKWDKFSDLQNKVPNTYGGKVVFINKPLNTTIFQKIIGYEENLQKKIWWIILSSNVVRFQEFKEKYLSLQQKALKEKLEALMK